MRELDVLLERYLAERWPGAGAAEQAAFAELLELPDPELAALCLGRGPAPAEPHAALIAVIADITRTGRGELSAAAPVYQGDPAGGRLPGSTQ